MIFAGLQTSPLRGFGTACFHRFQIKPRIAAIAPTPTGTASCIYVPRFLTVRTASAKFKHACRDQRRIFAKTVPGDKHPARKTFASIARYAATEVVKIAGCVFAVICRSLRRPKTHLRERKPERLIGLFKDLARSREIVKQIFSHSDGLRALSGKYVSNFLIAAHVSIVICNLQILQNPGLLSNKI